MQPSSVPVRDLVSDPPGGAPRRSRSRHGWPLVAIACAALFLRLGCGALSEPDEVRYAEIAREMLASGDWLTPREDGVPYFVKPPLLFWATALSFRALGASERAARTPCALAGAALIAVTAALGADLFGAPAGVAAALILASAPLVFATSVSLMPDVPYAALIAAAIGCWWRALGRTSRSHRSWTVAGWAAAALAVLCKGPLGVALPLAVIGATLLATRRGRELPSLLSPVALAVFAAIALPWFVLVSARHPEFPWLFLVYEHALRFATHAHGRAGPWWYYLAILAGGLLPWSLLGLAAIAGCRPGTLREALREPAVVLCTLWIVLPLAVFSVAGSKLPGYVLPILPPIALLLGKEAEVLPTRPRLGAFAAIIAAALAGAAALSAVDPSGAGRRIAEARMLARGLGVPLVALATAPALAAAALAVRGARASVAALALGLLAAYQVAASARDLVPNERALGMAVRRHVATGERVVSYRHLIHSIPYYARTPEAVVHLPEVALVRANAERAAGDWFWETDARLEREWSGPDPLLLVVGAKDFASVARVLSPVPRILERVGTHLLVDNRGPRRAASTAERWSGSEPQGPAANRREPACSAPPSADRRARGGGTDDGSIHPEPKSAAARRRECVRRQTRRLNTPA